MPSKTLELRDIGKLTLYKRKTNRSLRLSVSSNGDIRVTMPLWTPYQAGVAFALSKRNWILAQNRQITKTALSHGQHIGKSHHLEFRCDTVATAIKTQVRSTEIIVTYGLNRLVTDTDVQLAAQAACWRALRKQAASLLTQRLAQLAEKHGLDYRGPVMKRMKSRWGSCDQNKKITLNIYLVQLPWDLIDYVILHELTHTIVLHHGPDFWKQLEIFLPKAKLLRKTIKQYRPVLLIDPLRATVA